MMASWNPASYALIFVAIIAIGWIGVTALIALVGGWRELAMTHPERDQRVDETFRMASLQLGAGLFPVNYSNCLVLRIGPEGIGLAPWLLFRAGHAPIFIPWSAIERCESEKVWFFERTAMYLSTPGTRLRIDGRAGRAIQAEWDRRKGSR